MPSTLIDPLTMAPIVSIPRDGCTAMRARRLWFAAKSGAAITPFNAMPAARVAAFLTCDGAFTSLADARDHVSGFGGDARLVFGLRSDGVIIKLRRR